MKKITLRLEDEDWQALRRLAETQSRSVNGQLTKMIRDKTLSAGLYRPARPKLVKEQ